MIGHLRRSISRAKGVMHVCQTSAAVAKELNDPTRISDHINQAQLGFTVASHSNTWMLIASRPS